MVAIHLDFRSLHAQASASVSGDRVFHSLFNFGRAVVHRIPTVSDTFVLSKVQYSYQYHVLVQYS